MKGSPRYRAGIIGLGTVGSKFQDSMHDSSARRLLPVGHSASYVESPRTELVSGADIDREARDAYARRWEIPSEHVYADYRDMLEKEHLDIVSIAVPTPLHTEIGLTVLESGVKAIYQEKPIASSLADADRMVEACRRAGVPLAVNHARRTDQFYAQARGLIEEGVIGHLQSLIALFSGDLMLTGTHAFDMLNFLAGDSPVVRMAGHLDDKPGFDPGGTAYLMFESGVRGFVNGSADSAVQFRVHAVGTAGEIVIGNFDLELWRVNDASRRRELLKYPFPQILPSLGAELTLIGQLVDAVDGGPPPISSGDTATKALEAVVGLHCSSSLGGEWVDFPDGLDRELVVPSL